MNDELILEVGPLDDGAIDFSRLSIRHAGCGELTSSTRWEDAAQKKETWRLKCSDCPLELHIDKFGIAETEIMRIAIGKDIKSKDITNHMLHEHRHCIVRHAG